MINGVDIVFTMFIFAMGFILGALFGYTKNYLKKKKYGTMNFSLKQVF